MKTCQLSAQPIEEVMKCNSPIHFFSKSYEDLGKQPEGCSLCTLLRGTHRGLAWGSAIAGKSCTRGVKEPQKERMMSKLLS
jgi:hypothetical protein